MPALTAASGSLQAEQALPRRTVLAQVRAALAMIETDPAARQLVTGSPTTTDTAGGLTDWLYLHWWCGSARPAATAPTDPGEAARGAARLEAARRTVAARSDGWLVLASVGGELVAARLPRPGRAETARVQHADRDAQAEHRVRTSAEAVVSSSRPGLSPRPGDLVTLRHGESGLDPTGGWWWAHTGRPDALSSAPLERWYVHARDLTAAAALVPVLLSTAAEAGCDVSIKCPPVGAGYGRRDALVVYLPRDRAAAAETALRRRADAVAGLVELEVPPLTRPVLAGVSAADDPGAEHGPVSYGQLRCSQVAALAARVLGTAVGTGTIDDPALIGELTELGVDADAAHRVSL
ncbi:MAG TPA: T3SS effector HopA1 family protein [Microlunatus sp.]|nr:T3SS effector HopA1 family protein [Microlunatus sp.]